MNWLWRKVLESVVIRGMERIPCSVSGQYFNFVWRGVVQTVKLISLQAPFRRHQLLIFILVGYLERLGPVSPTSGRITIQA